MNNKTDVIEILKKQIQENSDSRLFVSLAEEYRKRDDYERAIDTVIEGLKKHSQYTYGRVLLVNLYLENNMTTEAFNECKKILSYDSQNIFANKTCARISIASGDNDSAYEYYSKVLEVKPNDKEAVNFILSYKKDEPKETESIEQKDTIKQKEMTDTEIQEHIKHAEFLISKARYKEAVSIYNLILSMAPHARDILQKKEELHNLYQMHVSKIQKVTKRLKDLKGIFVRAHFKAS